MCALLAAGRESGLTPCSLPLPLSHPSHKKHHPSTPGHAGLCQRLGALCHTALRLSGARGSSCWGVVLSVKRRRCGSSQEEERRDCVLALWGLGADSVLSQGSAWPMEPGRAPRPAFQEADQRKDLGDHEQKQNSFMPITLPEEVRVLGSGLLCHELTWGPVPQPRLLSLVAVDCCASQ